jgi:hypothetical protein
LLVRLCVVDSGFLRVILRLSSFGGQAPLASETDALSSFSAAYADQQANPLASPNIAGVFAEHGANLWSLCNAVCLICCSRQAEQCLGVGRVPRFANVDRPALRKL